MKQSMLWAVCDVGTCKADVFFIGVFKVNDLGETESIRLNEWVMSIKKLFLFLHVLSSNICFHTDGLIEVF